MYYVYILKLVDGSNYTGFSTDLKKRIAKHNKGGVISTKNLRPVRLIWYCGFENEQSALTFEKYLKTASGIGFRNKHFL